MKATLYVKGVRIRQAEVVAKQGGRVGFVGFTGIAAGAYSYLQQVSTEITYKSVLPEDQEALVEMVKAAAVEYDFELKVIDVGKNRFLDRLETRLKGIDSFPTLLTDNGHRIVGDITEEQIKALFVNQVKNRRGVVRAL